MLKKFALILIAFSVSYAAKGPEYLTARSLGMGGAGVAIADDRIALYLNPAGLNTFRHKAEISLPTLALSYNPNTLILGLLTGMRIRHFANPGKLDSKFLEKLEDVQGEHITNMVLPETDFVFRNIGFAVYGSSWLDAVYDPGIYEPRVSFSSQTDIVATTAISKRIMRTLSIGLGLNYIYRLESPETTVWGRDIGKIQISELFSNQQDTLDLEDEIKHGFSFDIGALYHLGFFRLGAVLKNASGTIGSEKIDKRFDLGVGYWVPGLMGRGLLERVILTADIHDFGSNRNFWTKLHVGCEANVPMGALRVGLNQGYFSWGFGLNFYFFHLEFANYSSERGQYPGHMKDHKYLLVFRFGF